MVAVTLNDPGESNYIAAAEKAIDRLDTRLAEAEKDARWRKFQVKLLGVVCALLVFGGLAIANLYVRTNNTVNTLQSGSIHSCVNGNAQRAAEVKVWDEFLNIIVNSPQQQEQNKAISGFIKNDIPNSVDRTTWTRFAKILEANNSTNPKTQAEVKQFKAYIASIYTQRNCHKLYGAASALEGDQ